MFFEKDKTAKKTPKKVSVCELSKMLKLPLEEVKCDYTVSESDFTARICFYTSFYNFTF